MLRQDIEKGGARDALGMIKTHAMEHARAAVVAGSGKAGEAEASHHLHLILGHGAE